MRARSKSKAFTLVELLIVIAIIAVLVAILLPTFKKVRETAVTLKCLARMRQLGVATLMYVNDNKGSFPPMTLSEQNFPSGYWARPTIFPSGGEGFLTQYLQTSNTVTTALASAKYYCCPDLEGKAGSSVTGRWSYRYNYILGGQDAVKLKKAYGAGWTGAGPRLLLPWKIAQLRNTSNGALFAEGDTPAPFVTNGLTQQEMALSLEPSKNSNGLYGHNPRYGIYMHSRQNIPGGFSGITNIAYCDGSVRSVQWKVTTFPKQAFPDTWINPYHPDSTGWPVNSW
ncbi:hypothetical protein BH10PLA1_BH10PLA1_18600 [soil metagenome]